MSASSCIAASDLSCGDLGALLRVLSHKYRNQTTVLPTVLKLLQLYDPNEGPAHYLKWVEVLSVLLEGLEPQLMSCLVSNLPPPVGADQKLVRQQAQNIIGAPMLRACRQEVVAQQAGRLQIQDVVPEIHTSDYDLYLAPGASLYHHDPVEQPLGHILGMKRLASPEQSGRYVGGATCQQVNKNNKGRWWEEEGEAVVGIDKMAGGEPCSSASHSATPAQENPSSPAKSSGSSDVLDTIHRQSTTGLTDTVLRADDANHASCVMHSVLLTHGSCMSTPEGIIQPSAEDQSSATTHNQKALTEESALADGRSGQEIESQMKESVQAEASEAVTRTTVSEVKRKLAGPEYPPMCPKLEWTPSNVHSVFGFVTMNGKLVDLSSDDSDNDNEPTSTRSTISTQNAPRGISPMISGVENNVVSVRPVPTHFIEPLSDMVVQKQAGECIYRDPVVSDSHHSQKRSELPSAATSEAISVREEKSETLNSVPDNYCPPIPSANCAKGKPSDSVEEQNSPESRPTSGEQPSRVVVQGQIGEHLGPSTLATEGGGQELLSGAQIRKQTEQVYTTSSETNVTNHDPLGTAEVQGTSKLSSAPLPGSVQSEQRHNVEKRIMSDWVHSPVAVSRAYHVHTGSMPRVYRTEWFPSAGSVTVPERGAGSTGAMMQVYKQPAVPRMGGGVTTASTRTVLKTGQSGGDTAGAGVFQSYTTLARANMGTQPTAVVTHPVPCVRHQQRHVTPVEQQQPVITGRRSVQMVQRVRPSGWGSIHTPASLLQHHSRSRLVVAGRGCGGVVWAPGRQAVLVRRQRAPTVHPAASLPRRHNLEDIVQVLRHSASSYTTPLPYHAPTPQPH